MNNIQNVSEVNKSPLRVESLNAIHLSKIALEKRTNEFAWLQILLLRSWLSEAENRLPGLLPVRQPTCLVALEEEKPIAYLIAHPYNRRGTCWSLLSPEFITKPNKYSIGEVHQKLIDSAIRIGTNRVKSWVTIIPTSDNDQIANARQLGFQPLKLFNSWSFISNSLDINESEIFNDKDLIWEKIVRDNANSLWQLEKSGESSQLRQILDRKCIDLIDQNQKGAGILTFRNESKTIAIAGLLNRSPFSKEIFLELIRDLAWDERLSENLPIVIRNTRSISQEINILTNSEDENLSDILKKADCIRNQDYLLLGRILWRREMSKKLLIGTKSLESMIGKLQPQTPPIPSPTK